MTTRMATPLRALAAALALDRRRQGLHHVVGLDAAADGGVAGRHHGGHAAVDLGASIERNYKPLVLGLRSMPVPTVCAVNGVAAGAGANLALACDIVIAAPDATFAVTPARLGVPYNVSGMMTFMSAASLRLVKELAFTAAPISAERAERIGMINHVVAAEDLEAFTFDMAATIANNAPLSIAVMKEQLRVLAGAKPVSPRGFEKVQGLRRIVYDSHDYHEGIRAFKEKRKPAFTGK